MNDRTITFFVAVETKNPLNTRQHWRKVYERGEDIKQATDYQARLALWKPVLLPCVIVLTRLSTGKLDSHDALPASLKHVVDQVCKVIGVDDGQKELVGFRYEQETCKKNEQGVRVCVVQGARIVESIELIQ